MNIPQEVIYAVVAAMFALVGASYRKCEKDREALWREIVALGGSRPQKPGTEKPWPRPPLLSK